MSLIFQKIYGMCLGNIKDPGIFTRGKLRSTARLWPDRVGHPVEHVLESVI